MKKEDKTSFDANSAEPKPEALSKEEIHMLLKRQDQLEDSTQIPPPNKKPPSKLVKFAKTNTLLTVIISVFAIALIASIVLLCVYLSDVLSTNSKKDYTITLIGAEEEEVKVKYEETVINDVVYIDMNLVAKYAELSVSGSEESMKYISVSNNYMKFTDESEYAIINATKIIMPAPAIVGEGKCLIPYQVLTKAVSGGLSFRSNTDKHKIEIKRETYTVEDIEYKKDITFSADGFTVVSAIASTANVVFEYKTDISESLQYIDPKNSEEFLLLVNPETPLASDYVPNTLTAISPKYTALGEEYRLQLCAQRALEAMMRDMALSLQGNAPYITSAYRSYAYQTNLFNSYVKKYTSKGYSEDAARAEVLKTSALPGTSEHQSGLCVDFYTKSMTNGLNNEDFEATPAFVWLSGNAYKYGFILRYPENKTDITSYDYESWHFRFVGRKAATEIYLSGLCLEEYLEFI